MTETELQLGGTAYDFASPGSFIAHVEGTAGAKGGALVTVPAIASTGLYQNAQYVATPKAYGSTAAKLAGGSDVIFINSPDSSFTMVGSEFTIECYLGKSGVALSGSYQSTIVVDRNPSVAPYVPPGPYPNIGTYSVGIATNGRLMITLKNASGTVLLNNVDTGVDFFNLLSPTVMKHFLFQVRKQRAEVYLAGVRLCSIPCPGFNGSQWAGQIDFGNNESLNAAATSLVFDEIRFTKNFCRARRNFTPPTIQFAS